jgi:hypothetical protein
MTPLQKLIKQFEEIKDSNLESSIDVGFAISLTKSLLEEEKEVMCEFADDYQRNCFQKSSDDYYNETFKTKEK